MADEALTEFIDDVCGESRLRVEADLGDGFVRLRSSEAERRQAAQDIRSSEDIVIELLRNARDAGAQHIFIATQKVGERRLLTVIDDGAGIPDALHERVFEPRVTSKLDSAHMDKWGMHGRGMALFSISVNAEEAHVLQSAPDLGTCLAVTTDTARLGEKTDQSTFPRFERESSGAWAMRGPKNILRTAAEFALEHRGDCEVFAGTPVEVAATLYDRGAASLSPAVRAFGGQGLDLPFVKRLALASDSADLGERCEAMGLPLSERSARRILDGAIVPLESLVDRMANESFPAASSREKPASSARGRARSLKLAPEDAEALRRGVARLMEPIVEGYYLEAAGQADISVGAEAIRITVPIRRMP